MQLNACSGRKAQDVEQELSHALAAESAYWGGGKVANLQAKWVDFAESECTNEAAVNVGGTACRPPRSMDTKTTCSMSMSS